MSEPLAGAVGVRFTAEIIERVKPVADAEGVTVSTWIRGKIDQALTRPTVVIHGIEPDVDLGALAREMRRVEFLYENPRRERS